MISLCALSQSVPMAGVAVVVAPECPTAGGSHLNKPPVPFQAWRIFLSNAKDPDWNL